MSLAAVHFSSARTDWGTPSHVYEALHHEFRFTLDPCRLGDEGGLYGRRDGLLMGWAGERVYCNPPYGPAIPDWLSKAREAEIAVYLLPARTDTRWFHDHCLRYSREIRFIRGRLRFNDGPREARAPFPSMVVVYAAPSAARPA
jgi:hypothetical protein